MKKLTVTPTAFPATTTGLAPVTGTQFIAGDRGCLPIILDSAAAPQTTREPLTLIPLSSSFASVGNDYGDWVNLLCSTSGTCCTTNFCNASGRIEMNLATAFMLIVGLMSFWK